MSSGSVAEKDLALQQFAMRLSLAVGFFMLSAKTFAFWLTGSAAILSDAAESVVHVIAVSFAAYSLWLSVKPADRSHLYGHDKISFFSAGFEGAMIIIAAFYIIYVSIEKWIAGLKLENLGAGTALTFLAAVINGGLGFYLVAIGKKKHSLILEANGKHVLTDCWTSLGVVVGLCLAMLTGWLFLDPVIAILVALNILWTGGQLIRQSIGGLMDEVHPDVEARIINLLNPLTESQGIQYHSLRYRSTGNTLWIELHLLFPKGILLENAHAIATSLEERLKQDLHLRTEVTTHLETLEDHAEIHSDFHDQTP